MRADEATAAAESPAPREEPRPLGADGAVRPRLAVSSCLIGELVRFNGGHSRDRFLSNALGGHVDWVPVCPEIEIGLGSPREPVRLERSPCGVRLMSRRTRRDLTAPMLELAATRAGALDVDGYVFKSKSPTCGTHGIPVHGEGTSVDRHGRGMFAEVIMESHPLLPVEDEGRLHDDVLREAFVERIFAHARLRAFLDSAWRPGDLVAFHARHKMQILAHDPAAYGTLGRLVARAGTLPRDLLAAGYAHGFASALATRASIGRNVNVLHHCLGMISERLDPARRADLLEVIHAYQSRRVPLSVPLALLRHHSLAADAEYVRDQTYFSLYPDDLGLRNHVPA
ncbi:DUF523 and DUF1722 domain-containing protein [Sphaerisporangium sp. TRM90804]|uniref:YbgA family protein n=1 Tax=Sphaerisporangium sp. TRM90804 TaxID=3031113 RepID=UPI00244B0644|nr:DUF523 and DUF1722 domain-containing protein [Sphaerisporangium sp. TRM90804]MDH2429640.1 DUF523 and DUF1722 domain-containing protein [Sphaerisporangium sp. TRM90804]